MAAALAVVGLGQVDELEEEGEGARKLVVGGVGERLDAAERVAEMLLGQRGVGVSGVGSGMRSGIGFAAGDGGAAQVFDDLVERQARLLAQDFAQQRAESARRGAEELPSTRRWAPEAPSDAAASRLGTKERA